MKTFRCIALVLVFCLITISNAQNKDTLEFNNYLKGGRWALQFELGTYINPSYFKSVELSIKPQLSRSTALRLGLGFNLNNSSGKSVVAVFTGPVGSKNTDLGLSLNFIDYLNPAGRVCFYLGFGALYEYSESKSDYFNGNIYSGGSYTDESHASSRAWYAGGTGLLGVEWFLLERISILAEYNLVYKAGKYVSTSTDISTSSFNPTIIRVRNENSDRTVFQFNIVKLGISAYF
ncbi:MAG: hypothetical protein ACHQIH_04450 [Ignavibacteria bacterium]